MLYHNFKNIECGTAITPKRFQQHLDMLKREGFNVVSVPDVILFLNGKKELPVNAVAITMDDGHKSNYTVAFRELVKRNLPGTVFVVVKNTRNESALKYNQWLTWQQIRFMMKYNISVMSHSFNGHRFIKGRYPDGDAWLTSRWPGETPVQYRKRIYNDLLKSRLIMEGRLKTKVDNLALPFGIYNKDVINIAEKAGYKYIWTTVEAPVTPYSTLTELPRVSVGIKDTTAQYLKHKIITVGQSSRNLSCLHFTQEPGNLAEDCSLINYDRLHTAVFRP